ncbi:MAG: DMT family transporter [Planctomycetales bacterium]|nr:DMT family transporter [Planctomycetales bacterium]
MPFHLCFPLIASLLFAIGLMFVKRASSSGAGPWAVTLVTNSWAAILFSGLWFLGGTPQPWTLYYQPAIVALLYMAGQIFTFLAVERGDVSVAAPILSTKVLMVAVFVTVIAGEQLSLTTWVAATVATIGIAMIQRSGGAHTPSERVVFSVVCALAAATDFALFDVLVQRWSPAWGSGRFLPLVFGAAGLMSIGLIPFVNRAIVRERTTWQPLLTGGFFIALQSLFIVLALAWYGDAARVNIVYALRGIWGVLLAWIFAHWLGGGEASASRGTMRRRLIGASLLTAAVIAAIAAR